MNPLQRLPELGQSVWLDYIRRHMLEAGDIPRLIQEDGLRGVTSNPAIFEKAVAGSTDYTASIAQLEGAVDQDPMHLYEAVAIEDIRMAADQLRPVYDSTAARDGYVSMEVSPYLARDTKGTVAEARRLWAAVDRPNLLVKVPATEEGIPAIQTLISEGINVNITLIFGRSQYQAVAEAWLAGLEARVAAGREIGQVASVASFFVSRIDTAVDALLAARIQNDPEQSGPLSQLLGKAAIANARLAYRAYQQMVESARWQSLAAHGAQSQRLLWASTSCKNPAYSDVTYVEELIGADTVNTMPPATMDAFRDHGKPAVNITKDVDAASEVMSSLTQVGIDFAAVTAGLLKDGLDQFSQAFDRLLAAVEKSREAALPAAMDTLDFKAPQVLLDAVAANVEEWRTGGKVRRLWARDATLWTGQDEAKWLDWLTVVDDQLETVEALKLLAEDIAEDHFTYVALLGMGGSSLCPEVLAETFGQQAGHPELRVLDSTDPAQIAAFEAGIDLGSTLFVVSSKSGSTLEPNIFLDYFLDKVRRTVGPAEAPSRFVAVTDPGSNLQKQAQALRFRTVMPGVPGIGGRYSALSNFGMVPAALMGLDVERFLHRAAEMAHACAWCVPPAVNPGVMLGAILGTCALNGRDKVTFISSPGIYDLGAWLEQLLAESTGKEGHGLIPVDREPPIDIECYWNDRLFVYLRLESDPGAYQDSRAEAIRQAGQPVVTVTVRDVYDIGQEFFRWEIATAVAGSIIGINAFNQPDVEASKIETKRLTSEYEETGSLPAEEPIAVFGEIRLFADKANADYLRQCLREATLSGWIRAHLGRINEFDYVAILAYIQRCDEYREPLQRMRAMVAERQRVATCLGFGPRFLHSTGQAYKGGPNSGVFLQVTCDDACDLDVPGRKLSFSVVKAAQARGDLAVLAERGRRLLRVHLGADVQAGLLEIEQAIHNAI